MKEKELKELEDLLFEELIKNAELVDEVTDNADINGTYQLNKKQGNLMVF
jgi:hypothetical protein